MTALEAATKSLKTTIEHGQNETVADKEIEIGVSVAQAWAAIAQAEHLKRIADSLEKLERLGPPILHMKE